eukprot:2778277-Amphidinium_carterae.5
MCSHYEHCLAAKVAAAPTHTCMSLAAVDDLETNYAWWRAYWVSLEIARPEQQQCLQGTCDTYCSTSPAPDASEIPFPCFKEPPGQCAAFQPFGPCDTRESCSSGTAAKKSDALQNGVVWPDTIIEMGVTSLMIQGLSHHVTQQTLKTKLDAMGFEGFYNYLHVPQSTKRRSQGCKGYAFVNCLYSSTAAQLLSLIHISEPTRPRLI